MRPGRWRRLLFGRRLLSPLGLLQRAAVLTLLFLLLHALGLREHTRVFSGTAPDWPSALLGASYAVLYLAFVVVVPVQLIAAALLLAVQVAVARLGRVPPGGRAAGPPAP